MEVTADFWCRSLVGRGHKSGEEEQSGVAPLQRENEGNESCFTCLLLATVWQRRKDRWCERITCPRGRPPHSREVSGCQGRGHPWDQQQEGGLQTHEGGKAGVGTCGSSQCFSVFGLRTRGGQRVG